MPHCRHDLGRPSAPARTTEAAARHPGAAVTIVQIPHDDASVTASRKISRMMTAGRTSPLCQGQCAAVCREGNRHLGADETAAPANQGGPFRCHSPIRFSYARRLAQSELPRKLGYQSADAPISDEPGPAANGVSWPVADPVSCCSTVCRGCSGCRSPLAICHSQRWCRHCPQRRPEQRQRAPRLWLQV